MNQHKHSMNAAVIQSSSLELQVQCNVCDVDVQLCHMVTSPSACGWSYLEGQHVNVIALTSFVSNFVKKCHCDGYLLPSRSPWLGTKKGAR
jgi:hypothetical protein